MIALPELNIREVQTNDFETVWELHNRALEATGAHAGNGEWDEDVRDPIASYARSGGNFLVCELEGSIVAMGGYTVAEEGTVEIKRMRVDPNNQGMGVGWMLLRALESDAKARGFSIAILETTRQQTAAQELYERNGYVRTHQSQLAQFEVLHYKKEL